MLLEVAVKSPVRRLFTYESDRPVERGSRVRVPFRTGEKWGIVWREASAPPPKGLKKIAAQIDEAPLFSESSLQFYEMAANYYGISLGELLSSSVPKSIRDGKDLPIADSKNFSPELPKLSEAQQQVVDGIPMNQGFQSHLILGETGSGKTEVYLHLMKEVIRSGGQVLFLVPEISLTPQLEHRLSGRLGEKVSVFHSNLKDSERLRSFASARLSQTDVFLGARSALFLPFQNLKLIVIDEEHDASYKQSEKMPYQARDLAIWRAKLLDIPIVLGSATPSLESYQRISTESPDRLHRLPRFFETPKIKLELIDIKERWKSEEKSFITSPLHQAVDETLSQGEQVILFLNRRGSASQRVCVSCGATDDCKFCSSTLTLHYDTQEAICHLCGFRQEILKDCASCSSDEFFIGGVGTKEVENLISERFPEARVARLDRDQTQKKGVLEKTLKDFSEHRLDILVGTQMISKGLDISKLSLIGVILADQGWNVPDFRAGERAFQLLHQIMGRAGRRGQQARCLVQTFNPKNDVFEFLGEMGSFEMFALKELEIRKLLSLPPYSKQVLFSLSDKDAQKLHRLAHQWADRISGLAKEFGVELMGPVMAPLFRWKSQFRYQMIAKASTHSAVSAFVVNVLEDLERRPLSVKVKMDRDPQHFL